MAKILIVDDEDTIRKLLLSAVQRHGHEAVAVEDGFRAVDTFENFQPDVVVSDIKMPKFTGFQMFEKLKSKHAKLPPVIFITGHGEKSAAVEALRLGAFDYLEKPFDMDDFAHHLNAAIAKRTMEQENTRLETELATANKKLSERLEARTELVHRIQTTETNTLDRLGVSPAIYPAKEALKRLTENELGNDVSVLLSGPSGSGKEVVAKLVHDLSARAKGPWVPVNCGALPDNLIESELFGHEKGAFSGAANKKLGLFELADGGTIFLDEIGELPLAMQVKLLRVLQERSIRRVGGNTEIKIDVRVVAATNRDLKTEVTKKTFREDLFFRLNSFPIALPSLKERKEDIIPFAEKLLKECTNGMTKAPREFTEEAKRIFEGYDWPGNVRELKSTVHRAALLSNGPVVTPDAVRTALGVNNVTPIRANVTATSAPVLSLVTDTPAAAATNSTSAGIPYHEWKKGYMKNMERDYLQQQLLHFHGNVSAMARAMKVSRPNLCRLLRKHTIATAEFRDTPAAAVETLKRVA